MWKNCTAEAPQSFQHSYIIHECVIETSVDAAHLFNLASSDLLLNHPELFLVKSPAVSDISVLVHVCSLLMLGPLCVCLQVYHLASVRLRDLCVKLDISSELRGKIWTCFEHALVHCTDLMKGRHLDQLLLCSVYIISKVRRASGVIGKTSRSCSFN